MELHNAWRRVLTTAESERQYEPPQAALRRANALFNVRRQESRLARVLVAAQLLFDSGLAAVPVGVRSMAPGRRKLLYASDGFLIDLLVECARERGHATLIGQVTPTSDRDRRVADVPVLLFTRTGTLAKTITNRLGEFHVELEAPAEDLSLSLDFERGETVITLAGLIKVQS